MQGDAALDIAADGNALASRCRTPLELMGRVPLGVSEAGDAAPLVDHVDEPLGGGELVDGRVVGVTKS